MLLSSFKGLNDGDGADEYRNYVMAELLQNAPYLNFMQFYEIAGNADKPQKNASMGAGRTRTINNAYEPRTAKVELADVSLKIVGDAIQMDKAYQRRFTKLGSEWTRQLKAFAKSTGRFLQDQFINGVGGDTEINGLKKLIPAGQVFNFGGENGAALLAGNTEEAVESRARFSETIDKIISDMGGCDFMITSSALKSRLKGISKTVSIYSDPSSVFGKVINVDTIDDIPLINAGYKGETKASGVVIPTNEIVGTSSDCTSIYFIKTGEASDLTAATNVGLSLSYKGLVGMFYTADIDLDLDNVLVDDTSVARLQGVRILAQ